MVDPHFEELRKRINEQLSKIDSPDAKEQITQYPWLYGALGNPRSKVVFVCENPSRTGVRWADHSKIDSPIEKQWRGHRAMRFRRALCNLKLKEANAGDEGGWHCYITNVVKEMNLVSNHRKADKSTKCEMVRRWADVLNWELCTTRPQIVFCVGRKAAAAMKLLNDECRISYPGPFHYVPHYSIRRSDAEVESLMGCAIKEGFQKYDLWDRHLARFPLDT